MLLLLSVRSANLSSAIYGVQVLQDDGVIFLWVTGRAMELGRECLDIWGYTFVQACTVNADPLCLGPAAVWWPR